MRTFFMTLALLLVGQVYPNGLTQLPVFLAVIVLILLASGLMSGIAQDIKELIK